MTKTAQWMIANILIKKKENKIKKDTKKVDETRKNQSRKGLLMLSRSSGECRLVSEDVIFAVCPD